MPFLITNDAKKSLIDEDCKLAEIPVFKVKCLHQDYIYRKSISGVNHKLALNFNILLESDLEIISFKRTIIHNLVKDKNDDDFLVFRFICDLKDEFIVKSNATPVIMTKGTFDILESSNRAGRDGRIMATKERLANWELKVGRYKRVEGLSDYHNEAFGIAHEVKKIKCFLKSDTSGSKYFNCLFIWDSDLPLQTSCEEINKKSKKRKTNIVFFLSDKKVKPDFDDAKWANEPFDEYYDNGTECCPI